MVFRNSGYICCLILKNPFNVHDDLLDEGLLRNPTPEWDQKTITRINDIKIDINDHLKKMKQGRIVLWALAGLSCVGIFLSSYFNLADASPMEIALEGAVLMVLYIGAALMFKSRPVLALSIGLGIYVVYQLLTAMVLPESLIRGILIKVVILYGLGRAISSASELKGLVERLRKYGVPREELDKLMTTLEPIRKTPRPIRLPDSDGTGAPTEEMPAP